MKDLSQEMVDVKILMYEFPIKSGPKIGDEGK